MTHEHPPCRGRRRTVALLTGSALLASVPALHAQDAYPTRPITMIVPFPPGGVADTVGRPVADALSRILEQPVIVENEAGAGGGIGMAQVARAKPDGYTLLMALSSVTILPEADRVLERTPMYQLKDLVPVARFTADPTVLVVRANSKWKTAKEFIDDAKARPGAITFGSSGNYGTMHVPMEMLKQASGSYLLHVPYTGAGPAIIGLIGEQVDALATGPATIVQHIAAGRLRALAHWGDGRLESMPEVPSLKELGYEATFSQWAGIFVPADTPQSVVTRLREASRQAASDERLVKAIGTAGSPVLYLDAPQFSEFVAKDAKTMKTVVDRIGKQ